MSSTTRLQICGVSSSSSIYLTVYLTKRRRCSLDRRTPSLACYIARQKKETFLADRSLYKRNTMFIIRKLPPVSGDKIKLLPTVANEYSSQAARAIVYCIVLFCRGTRLITLILVLDKVIIRGIRTPAIILIIWLCNFCKSKSCAGNVPEIRW